MQSPAKILIVDDEKDLIEILAFNLENEGFVTAAANSAEAALNMQPENYDLILLDIMMEGMSGFQMAYRLRQLNIQVPIIFLTAKVHENDILTGFSIGAYDYIKKPFSIKEVIARVKSVLCRSQRYQNEESQLTRGLLMMDKNTKKVMIHEESIELTRTEFEILWLLASHEGRVFSRDAILDQVWKNQSVVLERTVDVHIARLRKKLKQAATYIDNRIGFGYVFQSHQSN